ncbi:hypothetical protein L7F22_017476 [Adiantum nelumboides]|nr:hypothetical protein [Adiantum nelumboides]
MARFERIYFKVEMTYAQAKAIPVPANWVAPFKPCEIVLTIIDDFREGKVPPSERFALEIVEETLDHFVVDLHGVYIIALCKDSTDWWSIEYTGLHVDEGWTKHDGYSFFEYRYTFYVPPIATPPTQGTGNHLIRGLFGIRQLCVNRKTSQQLPF